MKFKISDHALTVPDMQVGDLVKIGRIGKEYGLILSIHDSKSIIQVYWPESNEIGWEKCVRMIVVSRA